MISGNELLPVVGSSLFAAIVFATATVITTTTTSVTVVVVVDVVVENSVRQRQAQYPHHYYKDSEMGHRLRSEYCVFLFCKTLTHRQENPTCKKQADDESNC